MKIEIVEEVVTDTALSPAAIWPLVSDTDRLNREAGLAPMSLTAVSDRGAARFLAETVIGPFRVLFEELPFEWTAPERLVIRRKMLKGPARALEVAIDVTPGVGGGSRVKTRITVELASRSWKPAVGLVVKMIAQKIDRAIQRLALAAKATPSKVGDNRWITRIMADSPGISAELATKLVAHVENAPAHELVRLRPYTLADAWNEDKRAVLEVCLSATISGLLALSWDMVCPSCRTAASQNGTLESLGESGHCDQCDITFGLELDKSVEATFRPTPAVRAIDDIKFCSGGPAMTPHVVAQCVVSPKCPGELSVPEGQARMRLFARGGATARVEVLDGAPQQAVVQVGDNIITPASIDVAPGGIIKIELTATDPRHVKLEKSEWAQAAATAHDVSLLPRFRERFSGEILKPGLALAVSRVTLLFSDLGASTEMYTKHGDAAAFRLVQDHFEMLIEIIKAHKGTLVKTIGDAVMAAFPDDRSALEAAMAMSSAFPEFKKTRPQASRSSLKIGLYGGACYVVGANGILDYFGQTVNVAARLQAQAKDDQVVITEALWAQAEEWGIQARVMEHLSATLKGIAEPIPIVRLGPVRAVSRAPGASMFPQPPSPPEQ